ncbi:MAG: phosphotransferase, partial [Acidimicrobiales bacterium]
LGAAVSQRVESIDIEPVGTGQMADSFRLHLHYGAGDWGPATIVGKFTAADEQSRTTGVSMRTSEVEVRFYQQLAGVLPIRTPHCHHADVDPATARFVLLLEDVAPARQGDQVTGCTVDEAASALEEMAKLHAPRWGDPDLAGLEWLNRRNEEQLDLLESIYPLFFAGFVDRYGDGLAPPIADVGEEFFPHIGDYLRAVAPLRTVQHADFRVDNLLFGGADGRVVVVDWQTVTLGPGAADLAYFLGGSLPVEIRRTHEADLVRHYLDQLVAGGVEGYGFDELWEDYRRYAYSGLVMAVGAAMMVERTGRGDAMFLAMAERAAAHAEDMESAKLLG